MELLEVLEQHEPGRRDHGSELEKGGTAVETEALSMLQWAKQCKAIWEGRAQRRATQEA